MKRVVLLLVAVIALLVQRSNAQSLYLGPQASFGHSWLNNMGNNEFKASPALGVQLLYMHNQHWGLSGSLMLSNEGYRYEQPVTEESVMMVNIQTINPMYVRFTPKVVYIGRSEDYRLRPIFAIGPSVAYKLDEVHWVNQYKMDAKEVIGHGHNDDRAPELIDDWDMGVDLDAGARYRVGRNTWLNASVGYYHGLVDVRDYEESENKNLRLNFGVMFGLGY